MMVQMLRYSGSNSKDMLPMFPYSGPNDNKMGAAN